MYKWLLVLAVAFAVTGCQKPATAEDKAATETVENQTVDTAAVVSRVQEIYDAVFNVYNKEDSLRNMDIQMENGTWENRAKFNADFCSKEWNALISKIDEIDSLYHSGELGFWEADYWIMGQDWHNLSISDVKVLSVTPEEAAVEFKLHNLDAEYPVSLRMVNEDGNWKIDDFVDVKNDLDWKRSMQEYVTDETAKNKK